jgi:hypothetical protein
MEGPIQIFKTEDCVICLDLKPSCVFNPCHHLCCCAACTQEIQSARMPCPLCREDISKISKEEEYFQTLHVLSDNFDREAYISKLRVAKNTGWKGNSKFARSVNRSIVDELEKRQLETKGGERMMAKAIEIIRDGDKVGRKKYNEVFKWISLDEAKLALEGESLDALECAIWYPEIYWCFKHHGNVEEMMQDAGILKTNKRNKV